MTREEAENLLDEFLDKDKTMGDYVNQNDYIVDWTPKAEYDAVSEYTQVREKLIELISREELKVNEVYIVIIHDIDGNPQIDRCFDNLKSANEYADYLHSQNIDWVDLRSIELYNSIQDFGKEV